MDRDCNKCIHHTAGACSSWHCEMMTIEDFRNKVVDDIVERLEGRKKTALDKVNPSIMIVSKYDLQEFTDMCFDEAIGIVRNAGKGE